MGGALSVIEGLLEVLEDAPPLVVDLAVELLRGDRLRHPARQVKRIISSNRTLNTEYFGKKIAKGPSEPRSEGGEAGVRETEGTAPSSTAASIASCARFIKGGLLQSSTKLPSPFVLNLLE